MWVRFSQKLPTRYSDCGENHNRLQMGRHTQNQIFLKFSTATAIHTMCDYICYIKTRASNSKRPRCLRTTPLSGFLKNRGRSRGSDLGEESSKASCPLWSPAAWAKRNLNHSVRVITTTREPPPVTTPGPMEDATATGYHRDGASPALFCFGSWWCALWCSGMCGWRLSVLCSAVQWVHPGHGHTSHRLLRDAPSRFLYLQHHHW